MTTQDEDIIDDIETEVIDDNSAGENVKDETLADKADNSQRSDDNTDYKKRYSDSSKEAKHIASVHKSYRSVLMDNSKLLDLDEKVWIAVTKQLFEDWYANTDNYEELIKTIKWEDSDNSNWTQIDEEKLTQKIREQILNENNEKDIQKILDKTLKKFDDKVKNSILKDYKESIGKRKLTPEIAQRELDKIILYNNRTKSKSNKNDEALSRLASNNLGWSNSSKSTSMTKTKLNQMWMPEQRQKTLYPELFTK